MAEHIPVEHQETYLENLFRHAATGVVLSWGSPGQVWRPCWLARGGSELSARHARLCVHGGCAPRAWYVQIGSNLLPRGQPPYLLYGLVCTRMRACVPK